MNRLPQFEQNWSSSSNSCPQLLQYLSGCSTMCSYPFSSAVGRGSSSTPAPRNAWYRAYSVKEGQRNCQPRSYRPGSSVLPSVVAPVGSSAAEVEETSGTPPRANLSPWAWSPSSSKTFWRVSRASSSLPLRASSTGPSPSKSPRALCRVSRASPILSVTSSSNARVRILSICGCSATVSRASLKMARMSSRRTFNSSLALTPSISSSTSSSLASTPTCRLRRLASSAMTETCALRFLTVSLILSTSSSETSRITSTS